MNRSKAKRRGIQAQRKKLKKEGMWRPVRPSWICGVNDYAGTRWENFFEFQRTVLGYVTTTPSNTPNRYYGMWHEAQKKTHSPIKCQVEIMEDEQKV